MIWRRTPYAIAVILGWSLLVNVRLAAPAAPVILTDCASLGVPGFYEVENPIATTVAGPCIDISASGVTLSLQSTITGDGTHGIGIHIEHGAAGTIIRGNTDKSSPTSGADVTGFDVGIEDSQGGSVIGDVHLDSNHTSGLLLDGANGDMCDDLRADNNGHDGIHIMTSSGARVNFSAATANGTYGVWIDGSSHTLLDQVTASASGTTDIEIGSPSGAQSSSANILDNDGVSSSKFGIVIEKGDNSNVVTQSGVGSGTANTTDDALDNNPKCAANLWFNNFFSRRKPSCIH